METPKDRTKWINLRESFKENALIILIGLCLNIAGRVLTNYVSIPFWMDSVGTAFSACLLGAVPGAILGAISSLVFVIGDPVSYAYLTVSVAIGIIVGLVYPRSGKNHYKVVLTAVIVAVVAIFISSPLNMLFYGGYTGNAWGDAMFDMLRASNYPLIFSTIISEAFVDFPDKVITLFIASIFIGLYKKNAKVNVNMVSLILAVAVLFTAVPVNAMDGDESENTDYKYHYIASKYDSSNGLNSSEINDIIQTSNGYMWFGTYSGLYYFDGLSFYKANIDPRINDVMSLYVDSKDRLWIGTNDRGVACYDFSDSSVVFYTTADGLASDSVRAITEDSYGNIYLGTISYISCIHLADQTVSENGVVNITTYDNLTDITYVTKLFYDEDTDSFYGLQKSGQFFAMKDGNLLFAMDCNESEGVYYTTLTLASDGYLYLGTSSSSIYRAQRSNPSRIILFTTIDDVYYLYNIVEDNETGGFFICGEKNFGYLDAMRNFSLLSTDDFSNSVGDMVKDFQGNLWFVSNKDGVCKFSYNGFYDCFDKAELGSHLVNAITVYKDNIWYACGDGLLVTDMHNYQKQDMELLKNFEGVRTRGLLVDSNNNLWISTYGPDGLVCLKDNGDYVSFNESNGTEGGLFRFALELSNGEILASSSTGLTYIKDDQVVATMGQEEGINTQILSIVETSDGHIYAASDGDGVYVIYNKEIVQHITDMDGLNTAVVLKVVPYKEGFFYVTSDSIYYDDNEKITLLNKFPYSNNYDIYISKDNQAWVISSAGIYVVDADMLVANEDYNYILLDRYRGFDTSLNANSWFYVDEEENIYFCCSTGARRINIPAFKNGDYDFEINISHITVDDDEEFFVSDDEFVIPAKANRIDISPAILNFGLSNPVVHMYLEGFDEIGITAYQNELTGMSFTNIPNGSYEFHIQILDEITREVVKERIINIIKEPRMYEHVYFKVYTTFVVIFVIFVFAWLISRYATLAIIEDQYEEIRKAKEEADNANNAKSMFLANMSHEIRTPINTILGMDELILREDISSDVAHYASDIQVAGQSLLAIVNDILDFSKIESGKMNLVNEKFDFKKFISGLATVLNVNGSAKGLKIVCDIDEELPSVINGDEGRLRQIMLNLISNAVKYTHDGQVTLSIKLVERLDNNAKIKFSVKDTGIGIRSGEEEKLFHTFTRLDEVKNKEIQGTGLGLPITKQLLVMMDSDLSIESEYGRGSDFYFEIVFPVVDSKGIGALNTNSIDGVREKYVPSFVAPDARILVVDDNEINLKVISGLLKKTRVNLTLVTSGNECLELVKKEHYDIIFLDHMMPNMSGIECFERLQQMDHMCKNSPVVVITANAISGAKDEYLSIGFSEYLSKPINHIELENMIKRLLPEDFVNEYIERYTEPVVEVDRKDEIKKQNKKENKETKKDKAMMNIADDTNDKWAKVLEINRKEGIKNTGGNEEFYQKILLMFKEGYTENMDKLNKNFGDENWLDYRICIHAVKSNARSIGADVLADMAFELEKAARSVTEGNIENGVAPTKEAFDEFSEAYKVLVDSI